MSHSIKGDFNIETSGRSVQDVVKEIAAAVTMKARNMSPQVLGFDPENPRHVAVHAALAEPGTFADVGGVEKNAMIRLARECGATRLTMIDALPTTDERWLRFKEKDDVECISKDVRRVEDRQWDVVHCGSVLHHIDDPLSVLYALRRITARECVLTAITSTRRGRVQLSKLVGPVPGLNVKPTGKLTDWRTVPTQAELLAIVRKAGFVIIPGTIVQHWHGHLLTMRLA